MTSILRRLAAGSAVALAASALVQAPGAVSPAAADRPPPEPSACSFQANTRQVTSTTFRFIATIKCTRRVYRIDQDISRQRSGKYLGAVHDVCAPKGVRPSCTVYVDFHDPAGTQTFEILNEYRVYLNRGAHCDRTGCAGDIIERKSIRSARS